MGEESANDFMAGIMDQLYENREVHNDHKSRGISYMILILIEQTGHLADSIAHRDWGRSRTEIFHIAAILFELFERIVVKNESEKESADSNENGGSSENNGAAATSYSCAGKTGEASSNG